MRLLPLLLSDSSLALGIVKPGTGHWELVWGVLGARFTLTHKFEVSLFHFFKSTKKDLHFIVNDTGFHLCGFLVKLVSSHKDA